MTKSSMTKHRIRFSVLDRIPSQIRQMNELVGINDEVCKNNLIMDRNSFQRLCYLLHDIGGLQNSRYVKVQEKVAIFLSILAHHSKNRSLRYKFKRSANLNRYLRITLIQDEDVSRNPKGHMTVNVLGVCGINMKFVCVLTGWEGPSWYPIKIHNQVIMVCCLLHNYIRKEVATDPLEDGLDQFMNENLPQEHPQ
ncbi:hypothetical protein ACS0TY_033220 [Phlomoides rotata]